MSQSQPEVWFCHECGNETQILQTPDPQCLQCHSAFVEKIENPDDDPRNLQQEGDPDAFNALAFFGGLNSILSAHGTPANARRASDSSGSPRSGDRPTSPHTGGLRFEFTSAGPNGRRTFVFGGNNSLNREASDGGRTSNLSDFLHANAEASGAAAPREPHIPGQLMMQYLINLSGGPGMPTLFDMDAAGINDGRWGDYVFSQEGLDRIMTQMMDNANSTRPVPATEEIMEKLPREVLEEGSPLLEKDCAVCKETFSPTAEDPLEQVVVTLPCKHPFHEGCIIPWLKSSGTCPICRHQLVPQPGSHNPGEHPAGNNRPSSPENERRRSASTPAPGGANTNAQRPTSPSSSVRSDGSNRSPNTNSGSRGRNGSQFFFTQSFGTPPPGGQHAGPAALFNMLFGGGNGGQGTPRANQQSPQPQPSNGNERQGSPSSDSNSRTNNDGSSGGGSGGSGGGHQNPNLPGGWTRWGDELD